MCNSFKEELNIIQELFNQDVIMNRTPEGIIHMKNEKYLPSNKSTESEYLEISGVPENALFVDLSKIQEILLEQKEAVFNCSDRVKPCRCADYLVFYSQGKNRYIICIELKQSPVSRFLKSKITKQLTGGLCFINYCQSLISNFWRKKFIYDYQQYYIGIVERSFNTRPLRRSTQDANIELQASPTTPGNFQRVYFNDGLHFEDLTPP